MVGRMTSILIGGDAEVRAVLADPGYQVPPAPAAREDETGTLAWLRASVARFCEGTAHDRRRTLAESDIARMDPARLRAAAARLAMAEIAGYGSDAFDVMPLARRVPLAVLGAELGVDAEAIEGVVDAAMTAAVGYLNPDGAPAGTDDAVALLVRELGPDHDEVTANRIGLLMQACDATAGLIGNSLARAFGDSAAPAGGSPVGDDVDAAAVDALVAATIKDDPPVRRTRRLRPDGEVVLVDLTGQTFAIGRRPCPGPDQATALAAGVVGALLARCVLANPDIEYPEGGNLRLPVSLFVRARPLG